LVVLVCHCEKVTANRYRWEDGFEDQIPYLPDVILAGLRAEIGYLLPCSYRVVVLEFVSMSPILWYGGMDLPWS
jgi:hypothetical protein